MADLTQYLTLHVDEVIRETEKAWILKIGGVVKAWPKSVYRLEGWKLYAPKWLVKEREF